MAPRKRVWVIGKRGWDADDPAKAARYLWRERYPRLGNGPCKDDTGDYGICVHCGFFCSYRWGVRLIRGNWIDSQPDECVWCVRRLGLSPPWPERYELPRYDR